ncbi:MAG: nitronate monooxygenase [Micromonosporaceae bacterium]|nr:nitronate monooxygenase [Micromonosporaceae bacterium]
MLGSGNGDREWLDREVPIVATSTDQPWGVGFLTWAIDVAAVERALGYGPRAAMLSFGDPSPFVEPIRQAGAVLIIQVTDVEEARRAVDLGADVIVAQGTEAGGHGARRGRSTLPFVPVVVDLAAPVPVLAAGGIADGRGWLAGDSQGRVDYQNDAARGAIPPLPVWAGEAVDLITDLPSAADLVTTLATQAEDALARAGRP